MQAVALAGKDALLPVVGFTPSAEDHYLAAIPQVQAGKLSFGEDTEAAADLRFAAAQTIEHRGALRGHRSRILGATRELSDRCRPFTKRPAQQQPPTVHAVAGKIHVGLVAVLVVLLERADWRPPARFITSF